jgi:collagen beta-1,O-galactosyltransferase
MWPIFVINLARRSDRRREMEAKLGELGLLESTVFIDAVDGRIIDEAFMEQQAAGMYGKWKLEDPSTVDWNRFPPWDVQWWRQAYDRSLKNGELGCSLSHIGIWDRIVQENFEAAIVLEDDLILAPSFAASLKQAHEEMQEHAAQSGDDWDMLLLGRSARICSDAYHSQFLVRPGYSSGTPGYLVSRQGVKKLLGREIDYRRNIIPLDEFFPALYTPHPRRDLHAHFGKGEIMRTFACRDELVKPQDDDDSDTKRSAYHSAQVRVGRPTQNSPAKAHETTPQKHPPLPANMLLLLPPLLPTGTPLPPVLATRRALRRRERVTDPHSHNHGSITI